MRFAEPKNIERIQAFIQLRDKVQKQALIERMTRLLHHKKELGLSDEQYAQVHQFLYGGQHSSSLTVDELQAVTTQFEALQNAADVQRFMDLQSHEAAERNQVTPPDFLWSENAANIQTLFRPWQPQDGYPEIVIGMAEGILEKAFPEPLRSFYRFWGRHADLAGFCNYLLGPHQIVLRSGVVIVGVENQGVTHWGIPYEAFEQLNPPVYWAYNEEEAEPDWELSHDRLSDFLDTLAYTHAFSGGAVHGGFTPDFPNEVAIQHYGHKVELNAVPLYYHPTVTPR